MKMCIRDRWRPGYDGEYGTMRLFQSAELDNVEGQMCMTFETANADLSETMGPGSPGAPGVTGDAELALSLIHIWLLPAEELLLF